MAQQLGVMVVAGRGAGALALLEPIESHRVHVVTAEEGASALEAIDARAADVLLVDVPSLGEASAALIHQARERWADLPIIAVIASEEQSDIVSALEAGASDCVPRAAAEELSLAVERALVRARRGAAAPSAARSIGDLVLGRSKAMQLVAARLEQIARSSASVLIRGESGTGKELVARALHRSSSAADKPFIKIDCASLPDNLLESELFGYEKGAFTGASTRKLGRVELAHGGVLFLDEVGELSSSTQAKLLRLLQDREFERLGGTATLRVEVRVIAATHRDLEGMVTRSQFRQDLFYRLNVVPIWLPPLRARRDDVIDLAQHFCRQAAERNQRAGVSLGPGALQLIAAQRWPGNVRQLQNFVERLVVLAAGQVVTEEEVQNEIERPMQFVTETSAHAGGPAPADVKHARGDHLSEVVRDAERSALLRAIDRTGGNRSAAARVLGVSRTTFYAKLKEYGLL